MSTEYLSAREIATRLDVRVRTVRTWIRRGVWPVILLPDGSYRVPVRAFDAWSATRDETEGPDSGAVAPRSPGAAGDDGRAGDRASWGTSGGSGAASHPAHRAPT